MKRWSELFPNGRWVFYEGDDPHSFVREMKSKYNFDPTEDNLARWNDAAGWNFFLPAHCIDEVYDRKYPLGS